MDVDHAADHFTPLHAQFPVNSCVIVYPEGHGEEEDEVGEDEVEYSDGGHGCLAGPYDVDHQAQADGTAEQNHRVDDHEDIVRILLWR